MGADGAANLRASFSTTRSAILFISSSVIAAPAVVELGWFIAVLRVHFKYNVDVRSRLYYSLRMRYKTGMPKENAIGVRLELDELEALRRAAKADMRTLSAMLRKYALDGLKASGYLPRSLAQSDE